MRAVSVRVLTVSLASVFAVAITGVKWFLA